MSAPVASNNPFALLGNDPPEDEPTPSKPPREVVKNSSSTRKRDEKPSSDGFTSRGGGRGGGGGGGGGRNRYSGNEGAYRDREAGRESNRSRGTEEGGQSGRGRGGRGRGGKREFDRRDATGKDEHQKQADHGWGAPEGQSEWQDELAGAELAQKDALGDNPADPNADAVDAVEEEAPVDEGPKTKTYDEYLAELANRQADLGPRQDVRRPNEGSRVDKKWVNAKELNKEENAYFQGEYREKARTRERKVKQTIEFDGRPYADRDNRRGGGDRGRGRGDRGGRGRGDRGDRGDRADRADRRGERGGERGGESVRINDQSAFPALGA